MHRLLCERDAERRGDFQFPVHRPQHQKAAHRLARRLRGHRVSGRGRRTEAYLLKARVGRGENVAQAARLEKKTVAKQSKTIDDLIALRIEMDGAAGAQGRWRDAPAHREPRQRSEPPAPLRQPEAWPQNRNRSHPAGSCAQLSRTSSRASSARPRSATRATCAARFPACTTGPPIQSRTSLPVTCQPCIKLGKLKEYPAERFLTEDEIRTLWHGLDRPDLPWNRQTVLAIRSPLSPCCGQRSRSASQRTELNSDGGKPSVDIPARRVKKRPRDQPAALRSGDGDRRRGAQIGGDHPFHFPVASTMRRWPARRWPTRCAARGGSRPARRSSRRGLCELLGIEPFTPHDLRRTAATMCGELELPDGKISLCLDHQPSKDENGKPLPAVTRKHYNLATRIVLKKKRDVLDPWATELRRIIGEPVQAKAADAELRLAA